MGLFNIFHRKSEGAKLFYHTDVHSHILPEVDHGSQSVDQSLEMIEAEMRMGINRIVLTSHVTEGTFENSPETLEPAFETLQEAVSEAALPVELYLSAEYRMDELWNQQWLDRHILPMPGGYMLMENSFLQERLGLDELLYDLRVNGYKTILAHPERYGYYGARRQRLEAIHNSGTKFQVNILSLAGYFGRHARELALWIIKNGMCDMLGSDMHNLEHALIIRDYIKSKDWQKQVKKLEGHLLNDSVR